MKMKIDFYSPFNIQNNQNMININQQQNSNTGLSQSYHGGGINNYYQNNAQVPNQYNEANMNNNNPQIAKGINQNPLVNNN